jgi:hypothetical protein
MFNVRLSMYVNDSMHSYKDMGLCTCTGEYHWGSNSMNCPASPQMAHSRCRLDGGRVVGL